MLSRIIFPALIHRDGNLPSWSTLKLMSLARRPGGYVGVKYFGRGLDLLSVMLVLSD